MSREELNNLLENILTGAETAASFAGVIAPEILPFIAMGKALETLVPGLADTMAKWIEGTPPTEEEKAELRAKLAVLGNPDLP